MSFGTFIWDACLLLAVREFPAPKTPGSPLRPISHNQVPRSCEGSDSQSFSVRPNIAASPARICHFIMQDVEAMLMSEV